MILLVVGLVAVIMVVLIAVFLSIRLGRGDEPDELDIRPIGSDRRRAGEEDRWRERDARRAPPVSARAAGRDAARGRERAARSRDYEDEPRRPARQEAPGYRRPAPSRSPAVPVSAHARGRYDAGPEQRPVADDYSSADYPFMDFGPAGGHPSGELPAVGYGYSDEFPSEELPSVPARAPRRPPARPDRDRPDSRRKAAPAPGNGKSRSRQRGKRDDDDDWPSTEWDELSDEQYWAELSADKPLAAMAKPSRSASTSKARPAADPSGAREARPARMPAPAPAPPRRDLPARTERGGLGARAEDTGPV